MYSFDAIMSIKFQFMIEFTRGFKNIYPVGSTNFLNETFGGTVAYLLSW